MPLSFKDMLLLQESAIVAKFKFQKDEPADKKLHLKMIFFFDGSRSIQGR